MKTIKIKDSGKRGFTWSGWAKPANTVEVKFDKAHCIGFNYGGGWKEWDMVKGKRVKCTCPKFKSEKEYKKYLKENGR